MSVSDLRKAFLRLTGDTPVVIARGKNYKIPKSAKPRMIKVGNELFYALVIEI